MVLLSNAFICYFWKIHEDTRSWTATTLCKQLVDPPKGTWLSLRYNILQMVDSSWFPVVQYLTTSSHTGYTWIMHIPYIYILYIYHLYTRNRQETCWARSTAWSAWRWCERFRPWSQQTDWRWLRVGCIAAKCRKYENMISYRFVRPVLLVQGTIDYKSESRSAPAETATSSPKDPVCWHSVETMRSLYYVCGLQRLTSLANVETCKHQTQTAADNIFSEVPTLRPGMGYTWLYKELANDMSDPFRTNVLTSQFSNCTDFTFFYILSRVHWLHMTPLSHHFHVLRPFKAPCNDAPGLLFHGIEVQIAHQRTEQSHEGNLKIGIAWQDRKMWKDIQNKCSQLLWAWLVKTGPQSLHILQGRSNTVIAFCASRVGIRERHAHSWVGALIGDLANIC